MRTATIACSALLFFTAVLFAWAHIIEPATLTITQIFHRVPAWTGTGKRVRAVALADLHFGKGPDEEKRLTKIVEKSLSQNPDIIFLLGDYVKGTRKNDMMPAETLASGLRPLAERIPVIGCLGNHDSFYGCHALIKAFRKQNIHLARKAVVCPQTRTGEKLQVVVTLDPDSYGVTSDIFPEFSAKKDSPTIVLAHSPDIFSLLLENPKVDLTLCGHTHGGQICLPGGFALTTSTRIVGTDFAYGLKNIPGGGQMFISRGLGTSILPMRLFCPPEILVIDFVDPEIKS